MIKMYYYGVYISITVILPFIIKTLYASSDSYLISAGKDFVPPVVFDYDRFGRKWNWPDNLLYMGRQELIEAWEKDGLVDQVPFNTAQISDTIFSILIPIKEPGRKYVRLYLFDNTYPNYNISSANFSVMANEKVLVNFPEHILYDLRSSLVIEFSIPVLSRCLVLLFVPDYVYELSFAFINGIEILSHPDIYSGSATLVGKVKGRKFVIDKNTSLKNIARLNVGGKRINILDDSGKLFRLWDSDDGFIKSDYPGIRVDALAWDTVLTYPPPNFSEHIAPRLLYRTARSRRPGDNGNNIYYKMTWRFTVDHSKYYYFVRLHFCEVVRSFKANDRVFDIHINGYLAEKGADVVAWTGKPGVPVFKDYVVYVPYMEIPEVRVVLTPSHSSRNYDTLLNGIEVFKISDHNGDLDISFDPFGNFR